MEDADQGGYTELLLLSAIPADRLSKTATERLASLKNRFPGTDVTLPSRPVGEMRCVGSPIPPETTRTFSDDEWLAAMRQFDKEWNSPDRDWGKGTAVELSRVLEEQVRADRDRFALLAERMDDDIHPYYFDAILNGLCRNAHGSLPRGNPNDVLSASEAARLLNVVRRVHRIPRRPCGRAVCEAFERLAHNPLADTEIGNLASYALDDIDPLGDEWLSPDKGELAHYGGDAHMAGYNSVRGAAARAIAQLLFANGERSRLLLPVLERMVRDPCLSVRTCVFEALQPIWNLDRAKAVDLFLVACEGADAVLNTPPFENFVYYAAQTYYSDLRPVLLRALASNDNDAVAVASRQICVQALGQRNAEAVADAKCVRSGTPVKRKAAAGVYAQNLTHDVVGSQCAEYLATMFLDDDSAVREAAADCFRSLSDEQLNRYQDLIRHYADSPAYPASHDDLLYRLEHTSWQVPAIALQLAERFIERAGFEASDISKASTSMASFVSKLVIRVYAQASDEPTRHSCLDLIDAMERHWFGGMDAELAAFDRQ